MFVYARGAFALDTNGYMGLQQLYVDYGSSVTKGGYKVCTTIWLLGNFIEDNGATRVVPGMHKLTVLPQEALEPIICTP